MTVELHRGCQFCGHPTTAADAVCGSPRCQFAATLPKYQPTPRLPLAPGRRVVIVHPRRRASVA